jgi:hypothetical protein
MKNDWFKHEKNTFFKKEKRDLFSPKKNKKEDFTKQAMKTAVALPLVAGGILVGTKLIGAIADA